MTIAWPTTTFSPLIAGQSRSYAMRVRKNRFGGGYQQRINENLNQLEGQFSFTVFTNEQVPGQRYSDLETLLQQSKGVEPYTIRFAGESVDRTVAINTWKPTPESPFVNMVSIEAELFNDPTPNSSVNASNNIYRQTFTWPDVIGGFLTVTHGLNQQYVSVTLFDNNDYQIDTADNVICSNANVCTIDMNSFGILPGTWRVLVQA